MTTTNWQEYERKGTCKAFQVTEKMVLQRSFPSPLSPLVMLTLKGDTLIGYQVTLNCHDCRGENLQIRIGEWLIEDEGRDFSVLDNDKFQESFKPKEPKDEMD